MIDVIVNNTSHTCVEVFKSYIHAFMPEEQKDGLEGGHGLEMSC